MPRVPTEATALLEDVTSAVQLILGSNLVGMYLYGSITNSSFNPKRSDIDCIVVTRRRLSETQFRELGTWLADGEVECLDHAAPNVIVGERRTVGLSRVGGTDVRPEGVLSIPIWSSKPLRFGRKPDHLVGSFATR